MPSRREEERLLARVDAQVSPAFDGTRRVVLAFSGGLASLVLAAVARKHGDLGCLVVGTRGAADVQAALVARDFLDYRLEVVVPSPEAILRTAMQLRAQAPALSFPEVLDLVPLALAEARDPTAAVLTGFGLARASPGLRRHLADRPSRSPAIARLNGPARGLAIRLGRELGLPDAFSGMGHRRPAEGSGIGPVLRALGHARHRSLEALVAGRA